MLYHRLNCKHLFFILLFFMLPWVVCSQISPPGMGKINHGAWVALAVNQTIKPDQKGLWQSTTSLGYGTRNYADEANPLGQPGAFMFNQEFKKRAHPHWDYSFAMSYRSLNLYMTSAPYERADPAYRQEIRLNGAVSYQISFEKIALSASLKQEFRRFYAPEFEKYPEDIQLRSRFKLKLEIPVTQDKKHKIIAISEQLFAVSHSSENQSWGSFSYKDSRFMLYYAISPLTTPITVHVGYMHQLIGSKRPISGHYFAVDLILKNPFT